MKDQNVGAKRREVGPVAGHPRTLNFVVPGEARAKARPQVRSFAGRSQMYKDSVTATFENWVRLHAEAALGDQARFEGPVSIRIEVITEPAKSHSARKRKEMIAGRIKPTKYPDLDNVVKSVIDGCSRVVIRDDVLVVEITASKAYGELAETLVCIHEV
ncbi:hypothetical protein DSM05_02640 [Pseudomonas sp. FW305-3-2-15-E-TSA4]|nr:hypothetical protein [Pseudomonas sp. FW305-3-2-15-E-TSA4]